MSYITRPRDRIDPAAHDRRLRTRAIIVVALFAVGLLLALVAPTAQAQLIPTACAKYQQQLTRSARNVFGPGAPIATLAGQTHQESGCRDNARSPVGALGPNQFMPGTAADMAARFPAECAPANPFDPDWAFRCRDRYMKTLLDATRTMTAVPLTECQLWWLGLKDYNGGGKWTRRQRAAAAVAMADPNDPITLQAFMGGKDGRDNRVYVRSLPNHIENMQYSPRIFRRAEAYEAAGWGRGVDCL